MILKNTTNNNNLINAIYESPRKLQMKVTVLILDHTLFYLIIIFNLILWVKSLLNFKNQTLQRKLKYHRVVRFEEFIEF